MTTRVVSKTIDLGMPIEEISKYITDITDVGIQIHPKQWNKNTSTYAQIDGEGFSIFDGIKQIAQYGEDAIIGNIDSQHISITNGQINFWAGTELDQSNLVAYVSDQELHIPRVVVVQSLQMGDWKWDATIENHLSLNWIGE